jgi:hypothetical protein
MAAGGLRRARPPRRRLSCLLVTAAVLLLAGCGSGPADERADEPPPTSALPTATGAAPVDSSRVPLGPTGTSTAADTPATSDPRVPPGGPAATTPAPAGPIGTRRCPEAVAAALPDRPDAVLVAGYETARFRLYYCRTAAGRLYYHGVSKANPAHSATLPATAIPGGFEARTTAGGSTYVYRVVAGELIVIQDGAVIRVDPVLDAP